MTELLLFERTWKDVWEGGIPKESVGAIFTKPEIVEFILELAGYRPAERRLAETRTLEPSCGDGAFTSAIVRRLLESERCFRNEIEWDDPDLEKSLLACDLDAASVESARCGILSQLMDAGCPPSRSAVLADRWTLHTDFLLAPLPQAFDLVVGNPPYVRIEDLPRQVMARYRELYPACGDRADLYIAFFERGLRLLSNDGTLAFICANRFAKNQYGRGLRRLIAERFRVRCYVNLEHTQPFLSDVSAYPAITVIDRQRGGPTLSATMDDISPAILDAVRGEAVSGKPGLLSEFAEWYPDGAPWISTCRKAWGDLRDLRSSLPLLEDSAPVTRVGIGVATGADYIFVLPGRHPDIETECQLPLLMAADISYRETRWSGHYLVNPFADANDGSLRDLAAYPMLRAYFEKHGDRLRLRHCAKRRAHAWYRTIDRVQTALTATPKLVMPDIQAGGAIGYDAGCFHPHHNVYWITSDGWNLLALKALLRSRFAFDQMKAFSVQMRGGSIRYQAQALRQLRLPASASLAPDLVSQLAAASSSEDQCLLDELAAVAFAHIQ